MIKQTISTNLICPDCGNIFPIQRKQNKQKTLFHRKKFFCYKCKKETNHIELKDIDSLMYILENTPDEKKTEDQQKVYSLLKRRGE
jgi:hypothetical protein